LSVLVADERGQAGGQYFKQPGQGFDLAESRLDRQFSEGRTLAAAALAGGAKFLTGATLWAANIVDGVPELHFLVDGIAQVVLPKRVVLAMGAYERPWSVPGWTLPGVMTSGAAQTLLRAYQTAPGKRVLIAGNGPLNLQVARELQRSGVEVVALVEQAARPGPANVAGAIRMALKAPGLVRDGLIQLAALRSAGVPTLYRHVLAAVEGEGKARRAIVGRIGAGGRVEAGSRRSFDIDAVCLGYGFLPQSEAARALGCRFAGQAGSTAVRDEDGRSSVASVFIAGDGGGLGGARVAIAQGILAGRAVALDLGGVTDEAEQRKARRALERDSAFQKALWTVYSPVAVELDAEPEAMLCRCENVSAGTVAELLHRDMRDIGSLKRARRIGMGACQGRYCGPLLATRLTRGQQGEMPGFAPRPPFKPIPISAIAGLAKVIA
jgi:NADPH-dependent 2,4-dienoyl-CoA reductase/sulfur reductase-like enzyme